MPDYYGPEYGSSEYPDYGSSNYGGVPNYSEPDRARRGFDPAGEQASLDALARSDRFIDALAGDQQLPQMGRADYELATMLAGWRDEMRYPEPAQLVTERQAVSALRRGLSERRGRRGLAVVGSAAAAVLCIGGFGTVIYNAAPGDALYSLRSALFGEQTAARDDQVVLAAQTEMEQVQELIEQGQWEQASEQLTAISSQVETVEDESARQELQDQWAQLNVQVETRDPNATVDVTTGVSPTDPNLIQTPPVSGETSTDQTAMSSGESSTSPSAEPSTTPSSSEIPTATSTSATTPVETSTSVVTTPETTEPSTVVELPPTSTTVVTPPPSTPVSAEPPPPATSTFEAPTITTTTVVPIVPQIVPELPAVPPTIEEPVAPAASDGGGDVGGAESG